MAQFKQSIEHKYAVGDAVHMHPRQGNPMIVTELLGGWLTGRPWPRVRVRHPDGRTEVLSENMLYRHRDK